MSIKKLRSRRSLRMAITPPIQRAAELRGIPINQWVQSVLHRAAWQDIVTARDILEAAGFADKVGRERREEAQREAYRNERYKERKFISGLPLPDMDELPPSKRKLSKEARRLKDKIARIAIVPELKPHQHVDHTRFYGPDEPCNEPACLHCHPMPVDDPA